MNRVNANDLPWVESRSPKGKYHRFQRDLVRTQSPHTARSIPATQQSPEPSEAAPPLLGAPFDVSLVGLPAGAANYPFHPHAAEWECYLIVSGTGTGTPRHDDTTSRAVPGDCVVCRPGDPHQITNDGEGDLLYYVIANNAPVEVGYFPDSDKWLIRGTGAFRRSNVPYFDDEE